MSNSSNIIRLISNETVRKLESTNTVELAIVGSGKIVYKLDGVLTGIDDATGITLDSSNTSDVVSISEYFTYVSDVNNTLVITELEDGKSYEEIQEEVDEIVNKDKYVNVDNGLMYYGNHTQFIEKGINTGDFWRDLGWYDKEHSEELYSYVRTGMGMNTIRVLFNSLWIEEYLTPGVYDFTFFDMVVANAKAANVKVVFSNHKGQGGFQAFESSTWEDALFQSEAYQTRMINMMVAIANRYKDEPTVLGYDMLNEPTMADQGTDELNLEKYRVFMQSMVDAIRAVEPNKILFLQQIYGIYNASLTTVDRSDITWGKLDFPTIEDDNICYEVHEYGEFYEYGNENFIWYDGSATDTDYIQSTEYDTVTGGWQTLSADVSGINANQLEANWLTWKVDVGTNVYFDNLIVKKYDESWVFIEDVINKDFETPVDYWDDVISSGTASYAPGEGVGGGQAILVVGDEGYKETGIRIGMHVAIDEGYNYRVYVDARVDGVVNNDESIRLRLKHSNYADSWKQNYDWLNDTIMDYMALGENVHIGELGLEDDYWNDYNNYADWGSDLATIIERNNISFTWHQMFSDNYGYWDAEVTSVDWESTPVDYTGS
jgi:hypothetical protein